VYLLLPFFDPYSAIKDDSGAGNSANGTDRKTLCCINWSSDTIRISKKPYQNKVNNYPNLLSESLMNSCVVDDLSMAFYA
jgi:hypothetical protein